MSCAWPTCNNHPGPNGYCVFHSKYGAAPAPKKTKGIPKVSAKKLAEQKEERKERGDAKTDLQKWYEQIMASEPPVCWETGEAIDTKDIKGWHGSIAHILPKKHFPSVATHAKNYLILKMWGGTHFKYDQSWTSAQKMKVWPLAIKRFLEMEPDIADNERKYIPNCLLKHIPQDE